MPFLDRPSIAVLAAGGLVLLALLMLPPETAERLTDEGGWIENVSAALLAVALAGCLVELHRTRSAPWLSGSGVALVLLLRELDFNVLFTSRSLDSTGFYRAPEIPLRAKVLAPILALPFFIAALHVLRLGLKAMPQSIRSRSPWVGHPALGLALVGTSRYAEKTQVANDQLIEEVAELVFAGLVVVAMLHFRRLQRAHAERLRPG
jgi:hypothetical protein